MGSRALFNSAGKRLGEEEAKRETELAGNSAVIASLSGPSKKISYRSDDRFALLENDEWKEGWGAQLCEGGSMHARTST